MKAIKNLKGEKFQNEQSFTLIYSGSTFKSGIALNKFITNLDSLKELIYAINDINFDYKDGYNKREDIEIKIIPKSGSIEEHIIIILSNPEIRDNIFAVLSGLFFYLLGKRASRIDAENQSRRQDQIEANQERIEAKIDELIAKKQGRNIKNLYTPLERGDDKLIINDANNNPELEIDFNQKSILDNSIKTIEEKLEVTESIEELDGRISAINIDTDNLKFHVIGMEHAYPLYFNIPLSQLLYLIAIPIRAKLKVRKTNDKIKNFHLISYKRLQQGLNYNSK